MRKKRFANETEREEINVKVSARIFAIDSVQPEIKNSVQMMKFDGGIRALIMRQFCEMERENLQRSE